MKLITRNEKTNEISTKEELIGLLKKSEGILAVPIIDYLNSLIELEFSVIRDYISDNDRTILSELELYKKIAIYNIYNRALNIFKQSDSELKILGNNDGIEGLEVSTSIGEESLKLFDFDYKEGRGKIQSIIPSSYKTMRIGNISLFQTIENEDQRNAELMRVLYTLNRLYNEKNPYYSYSRKSIYNNPAEQWESMHKQKVEKYSKKFEELDKKTELTDEEKREIEITKQLHELLLEDYGLTNESFEDKDNQSFSCLSEEKTELHKILVKRMPNISIKNNIKYI